MRKYLLLLLLLTAGQFTGLYAQEIKCAVSVNAPTLSSDQQVYTQLQDAINKYMNLRKWTEQKFEPHERIECRMNLMITERPTVDEFKGTLQVQVIRPCYNSGYQTVTLNIQDKDIHFFFVPFQNLEYNENQYMDNLTHILNYYAFIIIGWDQATFELNGGTQWFEKANTFVLQAQNKNEPGWSSNDGNLRNRYWLANNLLDNGMKAFHNVLYVYHRQGLDVMEKNLNQGRSVILNVLKELQKLNIKYPNQYMTKLFLSAKATELTEMFKTATQPEKRQLLTIMETLDPGNMNEYEQINKEQ